MGLAVSTEREVHTARDVELTVTARGVVISRPPWETGGDVEGEC
jgi:hypothetical protein